MADILPALYWIVYFGVFLEWRFVRLRGRGPARHRWLRLLQPLTVLVAILGCLAAHLNRFPPEVKLRGGAPQGQDNGAPPSHGAPPVFSVPVRLRQVIEHWDFETLRQSIEARRPVMVTVSGHSKPMHIEDLEALFNEMESRRSRVFIHGEHGEPVPLSEALGPWNEFYQFSQILDRGADGSLRMESFRPNRGQLFYQNPTLPPLEMDLERAEKFTEFDRQLRNEGFDVTDDEGTRKMSIEELNALNSRFDIYVQLKGGRIMRLTYPMLEIFYHEYPHVWMNDNWCLATPERLADIIGASGGTKPEAGTSPGAPGVGETGQSTHPTDGEAPLDGDRSSTEGDRGRQDETPPEDGTAARIQKE